jgi:hypothetical protein
MVPISPDAPFNRDHTRRIASAAETRYEEENGR